MTPEAQLVALLEWMGWKRVPDFNNGWLGHDGKLHHETHLPPLTLDLMHDVELKLKEKQYTYSLFRNHLLQICNPEHDRLSREWTDEENEAVLSATKEKRLEALLKTINKWTDE